MPTRMLKPCVYPSCPELVQDGYCSKHTPTHVRDPRIKRLYNSKRWATIRARQLAKFPLCSSCEKDGDVVLATEVDHIYPHGGDPIRFYAGPFQSLCKQCHSRKTMIEMNTSGSNGRGWVKCL